MHPAWNIMFVRFRISLRSVQLSNHPFYQHIHSTRNQRTSQMCRDYFYYLVSHYIPLFYRADFLLGVIRYVKMSLPFVICNYLNASWVNACSPIGTISIWKINVSFFFCNGSGDPKAPLVMILIFFSRRNFWTDLQWVEDQSVTPRPWFCIRFSFFSSNLSSENPLH